VLVEFLDAVERSVHSRDVIALPGDHAALMRDLLDVDTVLAAIGTRAAATAQDTGALPAPAPAASLAMDAAWREMSARLSSIPEAEHSVRVRTDHLEQLIDLVGELVIAHATIAADPAVTAAGRHELATAVTHAGRLLGELQALSMCMRMVPLRSTFQKLARVVRDVAQKAGKTVEFVTHGDDTALDRTVVDAIADPLVHMVRNAVDHGLERPDDREDAGKPRTSHLTLSAFRQGDRVVVELRDDGRGLHRERILAKAIETGLVRAAQSLTDADIDALIFAPGFSTADQLTDISGRGVGMDVVRRNIASIGGRIDIRSVPGRGTTFQLHLPLTRAVTDGLLVRVPVASV
jgi:two-component system chemotaxis sensor kinase CheA